VGIGKLKPWCARRISLVGEGRW